MKKSAHLICFFLTVISFLYLASALPVKAENLEVDKLRARVTELENKITQLESVIKGYYERTSSESYGWQSKMNWRKLKAGMTQEQVKKVLGEPIKIIDGVKTLWYYPNFYCGQCTFDNNNKLTGWTEP